MNLKAKRVPYSSTVGGGVMFTDEDGKAAYQVAIFGTTNGITKEVTDFIGDKIVQQWNQPSEAIDLEAERYKLLKECDLTWQPRQAIDWALNHLSTRYPAMFGKGVSDA